jgi:antitoxin component YwqK of YwqJK toxin-antitoxin module
MNLKIFIIATLLTIPVIATCQTGTDINKTDPKGMKQGHWIKNYPDGSVMYDGFFKSDHPVGEFKRYYEDKTLKSVLIYSDDGRKADATIYNPNGYIFSKGTYVNQKKEGKWQFFSALVKDYLIAEELYSGDLRNGPSLKFYPDSTVAERVTYVSDQRQGAWIQYYPDGAVCLKSNYLNGEVNGKYEVWFENGGIQFSGQYKNNIRDGIWNIFSNDGKLKYKLEYRDGVSIDRQLDIDESDYLDFLEKNKGKIADPEKTGVLW